ncbi:MAG: cytochrome c3 family protein [Desulfovibrionaceae bacterium]|nr:cytochrome c3 family protein [Desulfovibrionaceae bacterium]
MQRFVLSILAICALVLTVSMASAAPECPADMKLTAPEGYKVTKTPVDFSHAKHKAAEIECASCHHTWDGKGEVKSCAAAGCHDQPGKKGENTYYSAFHAKDDKSCLGCHKAKKKAGNTVVPVSCKNCHPK